MIFIKNGSILFFSGLLLTLSLSTSVLAQNGVNKEPLPQINKTFLVVAHIVLDSTGEANVTEDQINAGISEANLFFENIGATFEVCEFREIENWQYETINNDTRKELSELYGLSNRINVFYVSELDEACANADFEGITIGEHPGGTIVIKKGNCHNGKTIAHELGHYFGLSHTFGEGDDDTRTSELVDGSNCLTTGDRICDTPADPFVATSNSAAYIDTDCSFYNTVQKDTNGEYYVPDVANIMSYYDQDCRSHFTDEQYRKMVQTYLSNPHSW